MSPSVARLQGTCLSQELLLGLAPLDMVQLAEQEGWRGQKQMLGGGITLCSLASSAAGMWPSCYTAAQMLETASSLVLTKIGKGAQNSCPSSTKLWPFLVKQKQAMPWSKLLGAEWMGCAVPLPAPLFPPPSSSH